MEATQSTYDHLESIDRIDELIKGADSFYEEKDSIPVRSSLTFTNGFNVKATVLFVDIRDSKSLAERYSKPLLAKIYRSYISEVVAVLRGVLKVNEIYIEGDGIWGVFDTPMKHDIDDVFSAAARISSLVDILNYKYKKIGVNPVSVGIGLAYGTSLYIKSGYKNSGINEVVWLGSVVGEAARLCSYGNRMAYDKEIVMSDVFYQNLNETNKILAEKNVIRSCYHSNAVNSAMDKWLVAQS